MTTSGGMWRRTFPRLARDEVAAYRLSATLRTLACEHDDGA